MSASELVSIDPCTGETVWRGGVLEPSELDAVMTRARSGFGTWSALAPERRCDIARTFARLVGERRDEVARLIARETGKPLWEALTEADSVPGKIEISIRALEERTPPNRMTEAGGVRHRLAHRPHGVLAVLGPYNFPMHLPNGHMAPAVLAGNAVVFKPSEKTPASGELLAALWHEAGVPDDVVQVAHGGPNLGRAMVGHAELDGVLFTGGVRAGQAIHRVLAETPHKLLALELGGNNPLVVWDVADAEAAAHLIVQSAYVSAGQRCSCARRLITPKGREGERIVEALVALMGRIRIGAPFDEPAPYMGPLIDQPAADQMIGAWQGMLAHGGEAIVPLQRLDNDRPFLAPGLVDVTDSPTRDEEHFGPLLQLTRADDFDAALAAANDTRFGLAAGLISDDEGLYHRFWRSVRAGVVNFNRPTTGASSAAPFGGVGISGNHRPSAYYAADYCAYPVASMEAAAPDFRIGAGIAEAKAAA